MGEKSRDCKFFAIACIFFPLIALNYITILAITFLASPETEVKAAETKDSSQYSINDVKRLSERAFGGPSIKCEPCLFCAVHNRYPPLLLFLQLSLASKMTPSPDWFVGLDSFELCKGGRFLAKAEMTVMFTIPAMPPVNK